MVCAYLDDAGNTGDDLECKEQPIHYNGASLFNDQAWSGIRVGLSDLAKHARKKGFRKERLEFHGLDLFQGTDRSGWGDVPRASRMDIYHQCLDLASRHQVRLVLGCCDKLKLKRKYSKPEHPHAIAMWLCLERIARYAKSQQSLAYVVADNGSPAAKEISVKVLNDYRKKGAPFGGTVDFSRLIDTIHFMDSRESYHLQLCDLALYSIRRIESGVACAAVKPLAEKALAQIWDRRTIPY